MATGTITRSPLAFGFGQMKLLPSEANGGDLNTLTENGIYSWGSGGKPANAPWNRGVVLQERISNDSSASESFQISASSKQNAKELKVRWRYSNNPIWDDWQTIPTGGNVNWNTNGTHTVNIGTGTYLLLLRRPNSQVFELYVLAQNYAVSLATVGAASTQWDSVSFTSGTLSINVKATYCAASWVKLE